MCTLCMGQCTNRFTRTEVTQEHLPTCSMQRLSSNIRGSDENTMKLKGGGAVPGSAITCGDVDWFEMNYRRSQPVRVTVVSSSPQKCRLWKRGEINGWRIQTS